MHKSSTFIIIMKNDLKKCNVGANLSYDKLKLFFVISRVKEVMSIVITTKHFHSSDYFDKTIKLINEIRHVVVNLFLFIFHTLFLYNFRIE